MAINGRPLMTPTPQYRLPTQPTFPPGGVKPTAIPGVPKPATPTFQPPATGINPAQAITSQPDPRIAELTKSLNTPLPAASSITDPQMDQLVKTLQSQIQTAQTGQQETAQSLDALRQPVNIAAPDFSATDTQAQGLQGLLAQLMRGEGVATPNVTNDPAAMAYRVARTREAEAARRAEADRSAASGVAGSGDFDARAAQIREATGQDIAGYEGTLANTRRGEAIQGATTAAGLQLSDLERQRQEAQSRYESEIDKERLRREGLVSEASLRSSTGATNLASLENLLQTLYGQQNAGAERQQQQTLAQRSSDQGLLNTLLAEQGRTQGLATDTAFKTADEQRAAAEAKLRDVLLQQEVTQGNRNLRATQPKVVGRGVVRY